MEYKSLKELPTEIGLYGVQIKKASGSIIETDAVFSLGSFKPIGESVVFGDVIIGWCQKPR